METLIGLAAVILVIAWTVVAYNGLVAARHQVQSAWSTVDAQLERRYDLVPDLVETIEGYAAHKRETLDAVSQARAAAMAASGVNDQSRAESRLSQALFDLRTVAEQYPDLKVNDGFTVLRDELTNTEDKIAFARQAYNESVDRYDTRRQRIPTNVIASMGGFRAYDHFEADPNSRAPVKAER